MADFEQEHQQEGIDTYRKMNNHKIKLLRNRISNLRALLGNISNKLYEDKLDKTAKIHGSESISVVDTEPTSGNSGKLGKDPEVSVNEDWLEEWLDENDFAQVDDVNDGEFEVKGVGSLEGEGTMTANQEGNSKAELDLTQGAKDNIQKGVDAYDHGLKEVANNDNKTDIRLSATQVFNNLSDEDYVQNEHLEKSAYDISLTNQKLKLLDKNENEIGEVDLSPLLTGDLNVYIDDSGSTPEIVFEQDGVEVGRIDAAQLLTGTVTRCTLDGYKLRFKDVDDDTVCAIDLEEILKVKTKDSTYIELSGTGLEGEELEADLTQIVKDAIDKGVISYDWGDFREYGLGTDGINISGEFIKDINLSTFFGYSGGNSALDSPISGAGTGIVLSSNQTERSTQIVFTRDGTPRMFVRTGRNDQFQEDGSDFVEVAYQNWVENKIQSDLSNYYTKTDLKDELEEITIPDYEGDLLAQLNFSVD